VKHGRNLPPESAFGTRQERRILARTQFGVSGVKPCLAARLKPSPVQRQLGAVAPLLCVSRAGPFVSSTRNDGHSPMVSIAGQNCSHVRGQQKLFVRSRWTLEGFSPSGKPSPLGSMGLLSERTCGSLFCTFQNLRCSCASLQVSKCGRHKLTQDRVAALCKSAINSG